jgi:FKBP-type peptidyl-prolyl cis-trans isomerase FkpA
MKKLMYFLMAGLLVLAVGCKSTDYKKTKKGMIYELFPGNGKGAKIGIGDVVKFDITVKLNDSLVSSTTGKVPGYAVVDSAATGPVEVFTMMKEGDSAHCIVSGDSIIKQFGAQPGLKKTDKYHYFLKVIKVFDKTGMMVAQGDYNAEMEKQKDRDIKEVEAYLAKNNITAQKTAKGCFVSIEQQGTGAKADSGKLVKLMYTGKLFNGVEFDSNRDKLKNPDGKPLEFVIGSGSMIQGFDDGVRAFNKGGKGKIYVPSMLGYGPQAGSAEMKPYSQLIFEIEVVDVTDAPKAKANPGGPAVEVAPVPDAPQQKK